MAVFELASFVCVWLLIGISTASSHWFLIATSQLVGNSVSSIVPGGAAAGGPLQYNYMVRGGEEPARTASGLVAASLLTTTTLFGLAALCVPLSFRLGNLDARLERAAWLGAGVFVLLLVLGFAAFTTDGLLRTVARVAQWVLNRVRRRRPPSADLPERVLEQRDRVRQALGSRWPWARRRRGEQVGVRLLRARGRRRGHRRPRRIGSVAPRVRRRERARDDPDHARRPRVRGGRLGGHARLGGALRRQRNAGHARLPAGVVLAAARRRCRRGDRLPSPVPGRKCCNARKSGTSGFDDHAATPMH